MSARSTAYVPPAYAGLDGLQAILGLVWTQGVLTGDAAARPELTADMQRFYELFYGHSLTPQEFTQPATS